MVLKYQSFCFCKGRKKTSTGHIFLKWVRPNTDGLVLTGLKLWMDATFSACIIVHCSDMLPEDSSYS